MRELVAAFKAHQGRRPIPRTHFQGPQVSKVQQQKILDMIESGKASRRQGMKASGFGRELGVDAVKAYCDVKAIHWNYGEKLDWPLPKL
ncbi:hypothetical protein L1887_42167 [Cichorium endivia]|nr:hypothetical protein L1887_42167 [Cichorium endivia]